MIWKTMWPPRARAVSGLLVVAIVLVSAGAGGQTPSIDGTYRLVSRTLRDVSLPPERSTVILEGSRLVIRRSATNIEQRITVFDGKQSTATSPASVDLWEKID